MSVSTKLCSTKLTSNASIFSLLGWETCKADIPKVLGLFTFVNKFEIIKFLHETFDALFGIVESLPAHYQLVYNAVVHVIGILVDERSSSYTNFRPMLDRYMNEYFKAQNVHTVLLRAFTEAIEGEDRRTVSSSIKVRVGMEWW